MSEQKESIQNLTVQVDMLHEGQIWVISINRPSVRNCVDRPTAEHLVRAFEEFDADDLARVAILTGKDGHFCAGADLKAVASGKPERANRISRSGSAPMGISRMQLGKPVIAAVSGHAVAGGLELALWADLRVADESAVFGVFCRRFGVPLIDGGTVRLPRLIGQSRAMDLILTGRPVDSSEAYQIGLVNYLANHQTSALDKAIDVAKSICVHPQVCMRNDRLSVLSQWGMSETRALSEEFEYGLVTLASGETLAGAERFEDGQGRHGKFEG